MLTLGTYAQHVIGRYQHRQGVSRHDEDEQQHQALYRAGKADDGRDARSVQPDRWYNTDAEKTIRCIVCSDESAVGRNESCRAYLGGG